MTSDSLVQLARKLAGEVSTKLRVGTITALVGDKVTTDVTGTSLVTTNSDSKLAAGDRVVLLQQRSVWIVAMRVSGGYPVAPVQTPVGSIVMWPQPGTNPDGWLRCNGQVVSRTEYAALFAIVGTTYGAGDGSTTFTLPDLRTRMPVGADGSTYPVGGTGGSETVALTAAQMPTHSHSTPDHAHTLSHTHSIPRASGTATVASGTGATVANATSGSTGAASSTTTSSNNGGNTGSAGSGAAHPNMPPWLGLNFIIRAR